jgi:biopolymer transport protein TolR
MAEINIIPLVDVVFVLLIVFMVTAPLLYRGVDIKLPKTATNSIKPEERAVLTVGKEGTVHLDDEKKEIPLARLTALLTERREKSPGLSVYLRADREVPYGTVVTVMDLVKRAGVDKLGVVTEPIPK